MLLGLLTKKYPHYMRLLAEKHSYEEVCKLSNNCTAAIFFRKRKDENLKTISFISDIVLETWEPKFLKCYGYAPTTIYREQTKYKLYHNLEISLGSTTWERNGKLIKRYEIPVSLVRQFQSKQPYHTVYTSEPLY